jgi:anti-sigma B factor antagonist
MSAGYSEAASTTPSGPTYPATGFELWVSGSEGSITAHLAGELDTVTAPGFAQQLADLFDEGARQLTLDLAGLSFIDSSGLSALVSTLKRYRADGGEVVLRSPSRATAKVLEICGLSQVFTIEADGSEPVAKEES